MKLFNLYFLGFQVNSLCGQTQNVNRHIIRRLADNAKNPANGEKTVGKWLLGCSGMVFAAVVLGGSISFAVILYCIRYVIVKALESSSGYTAATTTTTTQKIANNQNKHKKFNISAQIRNHRRFACTKT